MVNIGDSVEQAIGPSLEGVYGVSSAENYGRDRGLSAVAAFALRLAQIVRPSMPYSHEADTIRDEVAQDRWYSSKYPNSIADIGMAEVMAYASKGSMEDFTVYRQAAEEALAEADRRANDAREAYLVSLGFRR